jgi:NADPH-dependent 2,4-dienoyl-CoA reductase/sulfur reductase-like enzyme
MDGEMADGPEVLVAGGGFVGLVTAIKLQSALPNARITILVKMINFVHNIYQEPILKLLHLQLQRHRCGRLGRF